MTIPVSMAVVVNKGSIHVLEKTGMTYLKSGLYESRETNRYGIRKEEFNEFVSVSKDSFSVSFE